MVRLYAKGMHASLFLLVLGWSDLLTSLQAASSACPFAQCPEQHESRALESVAPGCQAGVHNWMSKINETASQAQRGNVEVFSSKHTSSLGACSPSFLVQITIV